ncbi:MAG TPA: HD domain-containing phosphohydrolase [Polyangiaceae bacterium]|nr:HD domain-containing phosphohydrolase [Polyangiaceae bacterium]
MSNSLSPQERPRVLIVDDEKFIRDILADFLGMEGYAVRTAEDGAAALTELRTQSYDIVISDLKMPRMGGIELLEQMSTTAPNALTVIMTGFGTVETAIDAMKRGAYDYILKPFKVEEVIHVVQRGLEKQRLAAENIRLKEALSLYKVSEAIQASLSLEQVLTTVSDTALHELGADWVSTWLDDGQGGYFERQHLATASEASAAELPPDVGALEPAAFIEHFKESSMLLEHGMRAERFFAKRSSVPPQSLVAVPLRSHRGETRGADNKPKLLGWICALAFARTKRFDEGQRKVLAIVGSRAAAAIDNARLYEDLQATFQQTIEGLAQAIDKMDRYTAGHSSRVATYAVYLALRLGMGEHEQEIVRQSALMHDIGKIGCVLNLNKPGKLTQDEYEIFKKHPGFGRDILDPIKFLHPLIPGVHLHHERWDGRGYPLGLKGNDVPLMARIIAVADTYDAMTSDRAYRGALPHEVAVTEIERCSGTQFDPEVAQTFTKWLDELREELRAKGSHVPE